MHVYAYLKSFLFPEEYLSKKIGQLSGGEKNRVALALLFTKNVECLILDEPTNDLDIQTITILEEKLIAFPGAVLFVSHDRYFIDKIASKLLIIKGNGIVEESFQTYTEYLEIEKEIKELTYLEKEIKSSSPSEEKKEQYKKPKKKTKLSYKEQKALEELPSQIEALEAEIDAINRCLADPECYGKEGLTELGNKLAELEKVYEEKSEAYLELLELEEELQTL